MSKDAPKLVALTDEAKKKLEDCVAAMAACGFGPDVPGEFHLGRTADRI